MRRWPYLERRNMFSAPGGVEIMLPVNKNCFEGGSTGRWTGSYFSALIILRL